MFRSMTVAAVLAALFAVGMTPIAASADDVRLYSVRGSVENADGAALADIEVELAPTESGSSSFATTDATGSFHLVASSGGSMTLTYRDPDAVYMAEKSEPFLLDSDRDGIVARLTARIVRTIGGSVTNPEAIGSPIWVQLDRITDDGSSYNIASSVLEAGRFRFDKLDPARYWVKFSAWNGASFPLQSIEVDVTAGSNETVTTTFPGPAHAGVPLGTVAGQALPQCFARSMPRGTGSEGDPVTLTHPFSYYGQTVSRVRVSSYGSIDLLGDTGTASIARVVALDYPTDTRASGAGLISYGQGDDGTFCAVWNGVGRPNGRNDQLNTFQALLVPRGGTPGRTASDFDVVFNYDSVQFAPETGGIGIGDNIYASSYAAGDPRIGERLDGGSKALIASSTGSDQPGRYVTEIQNAATASSPGLLLPQTPMLRALNVRLGDTVSVRMASWMPWRTIISYQWMRDGVAISGDTAAGHVIALDDLGHAVSVTVTGSLPYYPTESRTSAAVAIPVGAQIAAPLTPPIVRPTETVKPRMVGSTPKILGTVKVGKTLRVRTGAWTSGTKLTYRWYANGKAIAKATKPKLKLTASIKGKKITVKVTGTKKGMVRVSKVSAKTKKIRQ